MVGKQAAASFTQLHAACLAAVVGVIALIFFTPAQNAAAGLGTTPGSQV
ncbi:hypothetical protein SLEP1_g7064 [Rubroshorea leprosula]|uniref:Uncharacterized protein n=1 Tax=Rubroshorea leprosula TaxID=152421 RepID=A0AAV5I746_9ROSI|nr:hypothetical protein SLEP1_g7064 [Rubroshorea leprosula]